MVRADQSILEQAAAWHAACARDDMDWDGFTAWLEADARGRGNWEFDTGPTDSRPASPTPPRGSGSPSSLPQVNALEIRNARLVYRDGKTRDSTEVTLARALLANPAAARGR